MKHLKKFESLGLIKDWNLLLSDEDFKKNADEFDSIVEAYIEYAHEGYEISFETAYGTKVIISWNDYNSKNEKYQEFIHGLGAKGFFFTSKIKLPYDYSKLQSLLEDVQSCVDRLSDMGWILVEFKVVGISPDNKMAHSKFNPPNIRVEHEFKK
jgi:hypothetical protein